MCLPSGDQAGENAFESVASKRTLVPSLSKERIPPADTTMLPEEDEEIGFSG